MNQLLNTIKQIVQSQTTLPFAVYSSVYEQRLLNVPIVKPVLVVVLQGHKMLGRQETVTCRGQHFVFLSDSPALDMRNIPQDNGYFALLIEFEYDDFIGLPPSTAAKPAHLMGPLDNCLQQCLLQFVQSAAWAPAAIWSLRKKEILQLFYLQGYTQVSALLGQPKISHQIHEIFCQQQFEPISVPTLCAQLAMSESTLRRRLHAEGVTLQQIKDRARFGLGLHLLQTTTDPISLIAEKCGYISQSRFTARFKQQFGLTPSALRKTRMAD